MAEVTHVLDEVDTTIGRQLLDAATGNRGVSETVQRTAAALIHAEREAVDVVFSVQDPWAQDNNGGEQ